MARHGLLAIAVVLGACLAGHCQQPGKDMYHFPPLPPANGSHPDDVGIFSGVVLTALEVEPITPIGAMCQDLEPIELPRDDGFRRPVEAARHIARFLREQQLYSMNDLRPITPWDRSVDVEGKSAPRNIVPLVSSLANPEAEPWPIRRWHSPYFRR